MRAIVTDTKRVLAGFIDTGTHTTIAYETHRLPSGQINIWFDEIMYVEPGTPFWQEINQLAESFMNTAITDMSLMQMSEVLSQLLQSYRAERLLFLEGELPSFHGYIKLEKQPVYEG